jgi:hypothetical protein
MIAVRDVFKRNGVGVRGRLQRRCCGTRQQRQQSIVAVAHQTHDVHVGRRQQFNDVLHVLEPLDDPQDANVARVSARTIHCAQCAFAM